ncbi:MAG: hypothetical protein JRD43_08190, partial [Deltaproteobacteria bacterium]|nr:hypothetical protein [Deltaproteobacteria bacterium]
MKDKDKDKSKEQLIRELKASRRKINEFEEAERDRHIEESIYGTLESSVRAGIYIVQDGKI